MQLAAEDIGTRVEDRSACVVFQALIEDLKSTSEDDNVRLISMQLK